MFSSRWRKEMGFGWNWCFNSEVILYLYYMGTTYGGDIPQKAEEILEEYGLGTWNRKRIGLAVADDINDEFVRRDTPLLEQRDCTHWDCMITTNPSVAVLPDGKFGRLSDETILQFEKEDFHIEDPFFWYDVKRKKFCLIAKDDSKNGSAGITGEWGSGFYAESRPTFSVRPDMASIPMISKGIPSLCVWN